MTTDEYRKRLNALCERLDAISEEAGELAEDSDELEAAHLEAAMQGISSATWRFKQIEQNKLERP
jgi:hypothetical protein